LTKNKDGEYISIVSTNSKIIVYSNGTLIEEYDYSVNPTNLANTFLSLTDLKNNGKNYITYTSGNNIIAKSINGINADNFPFVDNKQIGFTGNVISADISGTKNAEIFAVTNDGRIYAVDGSTSSVVNGFPLSMGNYTNSTLSYFTLNSKGGLTVLDSENNFYIWEISQKSGDIFWTEENGNPGNTNFLNSAKNINIINSFLPKDRSYNYPNPVYGTTTNIRYFVNEDSNINIKIFDISGELVAELNNTAKGGFDNETIWNVSNIQSGIYLARIEAVGNSGKT